MYLTAADRLDTAKHRIERQRVLQPQRASANRVADMARADRELAADVFQVSRLDEMIDSLKQFHAVVPHPGALKPSQP